jgi:hypothetical protein
MLQKKVKYKKQITLSGSWHLALGNISNIEQLCKNDIIFLFFFFLFLSSMIILNKFIGIVGIASTR